jgi:hypothetical protein
MQGIRGAAQIAMSGGLEEALDLAQQHPRMLRQISMSLIYSITSFDWTDG